MLQSEIKGFRLDWATSFYLILFPFIFYVISFFSNSAWVKKATNYLALLILFILLVVTLGNTLLYKEWQTLLSKRALSFLLYPKEIFASLSFLYILISFLLFGLLLYFFFAVWKKFIVLPDQNTKTTLFHKVIFISLTPITLVLGARGGFQLVPINESAVYFSTHSAVNHAAVNPVWYLGSSIWNPVEDDRKYYYMNHADAFKSCASLFESSGDSSVSFLKTKRPNIVLLVLESFTADVLACLGGENGICPNLDSLAHQGILFNSIYGSGSRTDQGLVSILSSFPAQPDKSIIKYTAKVAKLPSLYKDLNAAGYHASFYYGGEVEFANIGAYLRQSGVEKIIQKDDFSSAQINSKWGAHDEYVFNRQLNDLNNSPQPFFSVLLTLSNHEPFEAPGTPFFKGEEEATKFRNTAAYTDKCLGDYFKNASKTNWYSNTLFILVADHGHRLPQQNDMNMPKAKHIPLLFFGDVIQVDKKGLKISKIGNQQDISTTLLRQLELDATHYEWSKNLLNSNTQDFAYYCNENVLGWITAQDTTVFSYIEKKNIAATKNNSTSEFRAQAYLQKLYKEFLDY